MTDHAAWLRQHAASFGDLSDTALHHDYERDDQRRLREAADELDRIKTALADPAAVWANILRGSIAKPGAIAHLEAENARLHEALAKLADAFEDAISGEGYDPAQSECPVLDKARALLAGRLRHGE